MLPPVVTPGLARFGQNVSDLGIRTGGDLPKSRARLPDWCSNPLPSVGFDWVITGSLPPSPHPPTCSELACCVRRPHRIAVIGSNRR